MDGVEALFVREAKLDREYLDDLRDAKDLREWRTTGWPTLRKAREP